MSDLYRISGNGYHDWENMRSVAPDDWRPAAPPKPRPDRAAEAAWETADFMGELVRAPFYLLGAQCSRNEASPTCKGDQAPRMWPGTGGVEARDPADPTRTLKIKESALDDGVQALWFFNIANCDGSITNMRVIVPALSSDPFLPDENGVVNILASLTRGNWPTTPAFTAELRYWDPVNKKEFSLFFPLYRPKIEDEIIQHGPCEYSSTPTAGGLTSSKGASVDYNGTSRISAYPVACDTGSETLQVDFMVNGKIYGPTQKNGNEFFIEPTFTQTNNNTIIAFVRDTARNGDVVSTSSLNIYVKPTEATVSIYARYEDNNPMVGRTVTLQSGFVSSVPADSLTFQWEVWDPSGQPVTVQPISSRDATFVPAQDGFYSVKLTITGDTLSEPIVKFGSATIWPLSAPEVAIDGDDNPKGGTTKYYTPIILPKDRAWGPEDDGATCTWKLSHIDNTHGAPHWDTDFENVVQPCSGSQRLDLPPVTAKTTYLLELDAVGTDGAYSVHTDQKINVWPTSSVEPQAEIGVFYHDDGAIPFRPVSLQGGVTNATGNLTYVWEMRDNQGNLLSTQPAAGINTSYTFNRQGIYKATLKVLQGTTEIAKKEQTVTIYPFPKPGAAININDNETVYSGKDVLLASSLDRSWTEDQNAQYAWKITHKGFNSSTGQYEDIIDLDPASPEAQSPYLLFKFNESKTYTVELTVTGINNGNIAYVKKTTELLDVYMPWNGLPSAVISGNLDYSYNQGDTETNISGGTDSDDPNTTYTWRITKPDLSVETRYGKTIPTYSFNDTGTYFFKLEVTTGDGVTKNFAYRSVDVYPPNTFIPSVGIGGPYAGNVGGTINLTGNTDDPTATYSWVITPPSGPVRIVNTRNLSNYLLDQLGDWDFKLIVTTADGKVKNAKTHPVSVWPPTVPIPAFFESIPYAAQVGTSVPMSIQNLSDPNWTISWNFGDGSAAGSGASVNHTYTKTGKANIVATLTSTIDPSVKVNVPFTITITDYPVPNVGIQAVPAAAVNSLVTMSVPNPTPGAVYTWDFDDNSAPATGTSVNHRWTVTGDFQVKQTATINGVQNSITHNITIY
jgi:hypothetical protein